MPLLHDFIRSDEPPRGFHNSHGNQGACARALRMRLTRQRCQLALRTLSSLGETTPRRPRRPRGDEYPLQRTSRRPSPLTPTATIAATGTMHPCWLTLHLGGVDPQIWPVAFDRTIRLSPCSSTSVRSFMISSIIGGSSVALACRNPILPATLQSPQSCRPARTRSQARRGALPCRAPHSPGTRPRDCISSSRRRARRCCQARASWKMQRLPGWSSKERPIRGLRPSIANDQLRTWA